MWLGSGTWAMHAQVWWKSLLENIDMRDQEGDRDNIKIECREIGYGNERWMVLGQNHIQRRTLILAALNFLVLLQQL